jgi:hypothetical protein
VLIRTAEPLPNGDTAYEVIGKDIPSYSTVPFWQAIRFWRNTEKFGVPGSDWRKFTLQQLTVINLFDKLNELLKGK